MTPAGYQVACILMFSIRKTFALPAVTTDHRGTVVLPFAEIAGADVSPQVAILPILVADQSASPAEKGNLSLLSAGLDDVDTGDVSLNYTTVENDWPGGTVEVLFMFFEPAPRSF